MNVIHPTTANENPGNFNLKSEIRNFRGRENDNKNRSQ